MTGAHIGGAGLGGIVGIVLASLGGRIGLQLTTADAASLGVGTVGAGLAVAHALWETGLVPLVSRIVHGPKKSSPEAGPVVAPPAG